MLGLLSSILKFSLFTVAVLILGNAIQVGGRTVNDQIRIGLSQVERGPIGEKVKSWSAEITSDMKKGASKKPAVTVIPHHKENIEPSERLKLKKLIEDLNR